MILTRPLRALALLGAVLMVLLLMTSQLWLMRELRSLQSRVATTEARAIEAERRVEVLTGNAGQIAGFLSDQLTVLATEPISLTVPIKQELTIHTTVPFQDDIAVPINLSVPVKTTVNVPLELGPFGTLPLAFPIDMTVPITTTVVVPLDESVEVHTVVPLDMQVPVRFSLTEGPLGERLAEWQSWLTLLSQQMAPPER